ncbi:MAG: CHASE2 domain-containing protein, partial [Chitinivibrionales bacterium]|nr:CHASE2 domain-containing protein [Chitinivibrionales bacterium]MBD3355912.1 CHASE2 domain-containing protein [Chitinivibrionales bacterium]
LNVAPNTDGVIREIPLLYSFGNNDPAYMPIALRVVASLFGTPNNEIRFVPGKYIDIGTPFKVYKDRRGRIGCSYPNVTASQLKAILEQSERISALKPGESVDITNYAALYRDGESGGYVATHAGNFPRIVVEALQEYDMDKIITMKVGAEARITSDIRVRRDMDIEWVISAPYGEREWYVGNNQLRMLARCDLSAFETMGPASKKLLFCTFRVENLNGELRSSIPVLRGRTLRELCRTSWEELEKMKPGFRRDYGKPVRIPLTPENNHIVTYFGPKGEPFEYYSFYDIMNERVHGDLQGKIFIIGSSVANMFDIVSVPLDHVYPGVEVHASLMNSFLTDTFVTRLTAWQDLLILLLVGTIMGFISYMLKPLPGALLSFAFVFLYFLAAMTVFGTDNLWIEIARPTLSIILTFTAVMAYRYITEERDRKFLHATFKQYLSPELIDMMYRQKRTPRLGGDEGIRTAYFTDIQGFSTFSEKLGSPTRLVELLNEYLTAMTDILLAHYGTLDKYEGDAIIAFFGAPMPMEDHAQAACRTALGMQRALGNLRMKWRSEGDKWPAIVHNMRMRIGINSGPITTGNMGSAVRMNYTMMGDAVNLAARLESAAKQYGVYTLISDATFELVKNDFIARVVDKITVVGKSAPVTVYELLAERGSLDEEVGRMLDIYNDGLEAYFSQRWDDAVALLNESEKMEPHREIAPANMSPSTKIIGYCEELKNNPPGPEWDGVRALTSK